MAMEMVPTSLQTKQKENVLKMLDFNSESKKTSESWSEQWKILIYDSFGRDIISPILKLQQLRKKGVTLHLLIDSPRDPIADVPAIYFVLATTENIEIIVNDCKRDLYDSAHVNFIAPLSQNMMEYFAKRCVEENCATKIAKVMEQFIGFVTLEPSLFSLKQSQSYLNYNKPMLEEKEIMDLMHGIAEKLFSVLSTAKQIPVIRAPRHEGPAQIVANSLTQLIRKHISNATVDRLNLFQATDAQNSFQRPVLILMDRNEDLPSMLHHPSTYQALVDDLLKVNMNRVKVRVKKSAEEHAQDVIEKTYDLDIVSDSFFRLHAGSLFPDAIDANEEEMKQVTRKEEQIRAKTGGHDTLMTGTKDLVDAVDTLPMLVEKKKMLEVHTNIFQAAFEIITARHIPTFSMLEQKLINGSSVDKSEIAQVLASKDVGTLADKVRVLMIYFLTSGASTTEIADFEALYKHLEEANTQESGLSFMTAWTYIKKHTAFQKHASVGGALTEANSHPVQSSAASMSKFKGLAQGFLAQAAASVKNFLPENKKLHVTRVTDAICELRPNTEDDDFIYLDPKITANGAHGQVPRQRTPFREAIVFMIGGGNYNEYQNLMAYAKSQSSPKTIWYGCTELLNAEEFLQQLNSIRI
uniref:SEC1 family transporter SLY1 putative n=1 Tax=Albugo laibachii Nc14 TaxID=890382 RepID=F0W9A1_9STRA|nr:SEC1 family transporter SLY1 putative [Albugo laibachii Nc14]CCA18360.1 SEC1 family transporter SLY1 putative [Albugo laibachii Nc14]|eukprot:CCA18360.1 SEC1 family transporter SLY1 putative [Albugo laibachii Nc14]